MFELKIYFSGNVGNPSPTFPAPSYGDWVPAPNPWVNVANKAERSQELNHPVQPHAVLPLNPTGPAFHPEKGNSAQASQEYRNSPLPAVPGPLRFEISTENTYSYQSFSTTPSPFTGSPFSFSIFPISGLPPSTTQSGVFHTTPSPIYSSPAGQFGPTTPRSQGQINDIVPTTSAIFYADRTTSPLQGAHIIRSVATNSVLLPDDRAILHPSSANSTTVKASPPVTTAGYSFRVDFDNLFSGNQVLYVDYLKVTTCKTNHKICNCVVIFEDCYQ